MRANELLREKPGLSSKEQMAVGVFNAFKNAGFSDSQATALTGEVHRENGFQNKYIYGTHSDPANRATNVGMISWQGGRKDAFMDYMAGQNLLDKNGKIKQGQDSLDAQAKFIRQEMETNSHGGSRKQNDRIQNWLQNPNADAKMSQNVLGGDFIRWRINDPKYRNSGIKNINSGIGTLNTALAKYTPTQQPKIQPAVYTPPAQASSMPKIQPASFTPKTAVQPSFNIASLPKPSTSDFNIKRGMSGNPVRSVQTQLAGMGYNLGNAGIDGKFGKMTKSAVRQFQQDHGLQVDGIVGNQTMAALKKLQAPTQVAAVSTPAPTVGLG